MKPSHQSEEEGLLVNAQGTLLLIQLVGTGGTEGLQRNLLQKGKLRLSRVWRAPGESVLGGLKAV